MLTSFMTSHKLAVKPNILIDQGGRARLADFELDATIGEYYQTYAFTQYSDEDPEQSVAPERFIRRSLATEKSDCYALGMVIYEVLADQPPFKVPKGSILMMMVLSGERPGRPEGVKGRWFGDDLWEMLNRCWAEDEEIRPDIRTVRERLEQDSRTWDPKPLPSQENERVYDEAKDPILGV